MFAEYTATIWGLWFIIATIIVQGFIAMRAHRKQSHYVPGIVDQNLSHESFVFRSHRTHQNSLENIVQLLVPAALGMVVGANPAWLAGFVWFYATVRIAHMVLFYKIATEKNPSPRSYFFILGYFANIGLMVLVAISMV
ncbi:MAPEG family protein [Vibrio sp. SCSIO 43136]|uniref:MAPEG family protein n=1 Tax=Vibrio sp. SCSIO 43136 TaxID=2819101 RepID=UPI00207505AF|nr:MAPEG family protein [Vibrio sp. SCSIO 43136]USD67028.1 MAPEG family protein [Vibrio sp. SCSIO 43136]